MKALDLFCGGGGTALGLFDAGFKEVVGVDIKKPRDYPGDFVQGDVRELSVRLDEFDFIWASPPCQRFSVSTRSRGNDWKNHPDFIPVTRDLLRDHPFTVIENVMRAPIRADVVLTGPSVGLERIRRTRHFETSFFCWSPRKIMVDKEIIDRGDALTNHYIYV